MSSLLNPISSQMTDSLLAQEISQEISQWIESSNPGSLSNVEKVDFDGRILHLWTRENASVSWKRTDPSGRRDWEAWKDRYQIKGCQIHGLAYRWVLPVTFPVDRIQGDGLNRLYLVDEDPPGGVHFLYKKKITLKTRPGLSTTAVVFQGPSRYVAPPTQYLLAKTTISANTLGLSGDVEMEVLGSDNHLNVKTLSIVRNPRDLPISPFLADFLGNLDLGEKFQPMPQDPFEGFGFLGDPKNWKYLEKIQIGTLHDDSLVDRWEIWKTRDNRWEVRRK